MIAGRGKLSEEEQDRLSLISANTSYIQKLSKRGEGKRKFKVNRAIRDWLQNGKAKGIDFKSQSPEDRERQLKAIKGLRFLGIDPGEGTFYVHSRKG